MSAPPYIPLYIADYHADTTHLSRGEHGAYLLLLMAMWRAGGRLPSDDKRLAKLAMCSPEEWAEIRDTVIEFFKRRGGHLTHKRITKEMAKYDNRIVRAKQGGKASAAKKANENSEETPILVEPKINQPEPEPEPKRKELLSPSSDEPQTAAYPPLFELAWKAYPHVKGRSSKPKTLVAWKKLPTATRQALPAAVHEYAAKGNEPRMDCGAPDMGRWVREERFNDWLRDVTPSNAPATPVSPEIEAQRLRHFRDTGEWKTAWGPTPKNIAA